MLPPGCVLKVKAKKPKLPKLNADESGDTPSLAQNQDVLCQLLKKDASYCTSEGRVNGALMITQYFLTFEIEEETCILKDREGNKLKVESSRFQCYVDMHDVVQCRYIVLGGKHIMQLLVSFRGPDPLLVRVFFRLSKKSLFDENLSPEKRGEEANLLCKTVQDFADVAHTETPQTKSEIPFYDEYCPSEKSVPETPSDMLQRSMAEESFSESSEDDEMPSEEGSASAVPNLELSDTPAFYGKVKAKVIPATKAMIASNILTEKMYLSLKRELPKVFQLRTWKLVYSPPEHGCSMRTMYRNACDYGATLLVIKDTDHTIFGGFISEPWRVTKRFYGTGESFLYSFKGGALRVYRPTQLNEYYVISDLESIMFGAGGRSGLYIHSDLVCGSSGYCDTYGNNDLSVYEDFKIVQLELWGFA